jgi:hypothetical protein
MESRIWRNWKTSKLFTVITVCFVLYNCGGDGSDSSSNIIETGATLQGNIKSVTTTSIQIADVGDIKVSIGDLETTTDEEGNFMIENIPTGDQAIQFEGNGVSTFYDLIDIEEQETFVLRDLEIDDDVVVTEHTGIWTGTAGSTELGSHGQLGFTMEIKPNSNGITGLACLLEGAPDTSKWTMVGSDTGTKIKGAFLLEFSDSECARGGTFKGTFSGNTVSGTFKEVIPPDEEEEKTIECGKEEEGIFNLEKAQEGEAFYCEGLTE